VAEKIGIGSRAGYYDEVGALRDMVPNHMLQLLSLLCMEPPVDLSADSIRDEKAKVIKAIKPPTARAAVRARYGPGVVDGEEVPGYLEEPDVPSESRAETYVALRLNVDNWRWAGVPFYLRTGKRLARKETEIAITLRPVPHRAFRDRNAHGLTPNQLILGLEPNERIRIELLAKSPGVGLEVEPVALGLDYGATFAARSAEAYERLILDAMRGDATLFTRADEIEAQWRVCDPVVDLWRTDGIDVGVYAAGSQGPAEADSVLFEGHRWRPI
jgi:glucose-6-phosphate 1-dehydrogenase